MLEMLVCSLFTLLPDYLYRRYGQGKRLGVEIGLYSVWYELRYGITACIMLTIALITVIFYYHPATTSVTGYFRTVPILPETNGRVSKIYVGSSGEVKKGEPIFELSNSTAKAALQVAQREIAEVDAQMVVAKTDLAAAKGQIDQAKSSLKQALDELATKEELQRRNADVVAQREIDKLRVTVDGRKGALDAAEAASAAAEAKLSTLLPAEKASAEAARDKAEAELARLVVYAGVDGRVEQFTLRVGDVVNPLMRPAGVLIPSDAGRDFLVAGFHQIEGQVVKPGMVAEVTCMSKPLTIIPMVVSQVQGVIAAGQVKTNDQLLDALQTKQPGTLTVFLEPLYKDGLDGVSPGSSCIANAYTNNHDRLAHEDMPPLKWVALHVVDTVGIVHAMILRLQALVLPIKVLVLSGGH